MFSYSIIHYLKYKVYLISNHMTKNSLLPDDQGVINGFEMAVKAGPICEETLYAVAFVLEAWHKVGGGDNI